MITEIQGLKVNCEVNGNGDAVVFVHGLGGSLNIWSSQVNACARHFKTIAYDLRGSGRSGLGGGECSIDVWVEDLKRLLASLEEGPVHLVGHSMGTLIVQHFAVRYPELVRSLVLVGGLTEIPEAGKQGLHNRANAVMENGMDAVADQVLEGGLSAYTKHANRALTGLVRELLQRNDPDGYAASCKALANGKAISHSQVSVPVLLIVGDEDRVTPPGMARQLLNGFPDARLEVIPECGHWATVEKPAEVNKAILSFLLAIRH